MNYTIAVANSRKERIWKNIELSWAAFLERVSTTRRTAESVSEYKKLSKPDQDNIKDVGGFVGGALHGGKRKNGFVEYRSMLTLDMDYADPNTWERVQLLHDFCCCIYSTHKHTPQAPRLRLIVPLKRTVGADEYSAVARMLAKDIGIEQFDDTTYEATRLMYWPSTSCDGEFYFESQDGPLLDPDLILLRYRDWHNTAEWPVSSRQTSVVRHEMKKQADPLEKPGIIGSFCRTYPISEAIATFLSDVYEPSQVPGRYNFIPADSTAGLVVYDDRFAFSHHATDPASGALMNAFDLVRKHRFGHLDDSAQPGTPANRLPSYLEMQAFASADSQVIETIDNEHEDQIKLDFQPQDDWKKQLERDKEGRVKPTLQNLALIMVNDETLKGIVFNEHADSMEIMGDVPWKHKSRFWRDQDDAQLECYIDAHYASFSKRNFLTAVTKVTDDRSYHPIRQYFDSLPAWDNVKRIETLLIDYLGAPDTLYTRVVTRKMICAAVMRVLHPGIKFDSMVVMDGPQGAGKSTLIARLAGDWFSDSLQLNETKDKTAAEKLQGYWILEIGELAGLRKTEIETLRSFLSRQNDIYRASYGRRPVPHPRQCIFIGTTNAEKGYLRDITGNRRFWPIKTPGSRNKQSWQITDDEVKQIWAEALVYAKQGEKLYLPAAIEKLAVIEQRNALEEDEREGIVREYLERLLPENWVALDLYQRRNFLTGSDFVDTPQVGTVKRQAVSNMEIWCECFGRDRAHLGRRDSNEIQSIMVRIEGWSKPDTRLHVGPYGIQRCYIRQHISEEPTL